jgi:hypothetical protein
MADKNAKIYLAHLKQIVDVKNVGLVILLYPQVQSLFANLLSK